VGDGMVRLFTLNGRLSVPVLVALVVAGRLTYR